MRLDKLERVKSQYPTLAPLLDRLADYLRTQAGAEVDTVEPKLVAAHLDISEAEALGLLMLFERAGILKHRYEIVCPTTKAVIKSVNTKEEIEDVLNCDFCDRSHDVDELEIDLVFDIASTNGGLSTLAA